MFNVGGPEVLVILLVALIALGPAQLPEAARKVGKAMNEVRRVSTGFQRELTSAFEIEDTKGKDAKSKDTKRAEKPKSAGGPSDLSEPTDDSEPADEAEPTEVSEPIETYEATDSTDVAEDDPPAETGPVETADTVDQAVPPAGERERADDSATA